MHACCGHAHTHDHAHTHTPRASGASRAPYILAAGSKKKPKRKASKRHNPEEEGGDPPQTRACPHCSKEAPEDTFVEVVVAADENEEWCEECISEHSFRCDKCDNQASNSALSDVSDNEWCPTCVDEHAAKCQHCKALVDEENTHSVGSETWCQSCVDDDAGWCERCEEHVPSEDTREVRTGRRRSQTWCESCYDHHASYCQSCQEYFSDDDVSSYEVDGDTWCEYCAEDNAYYCDECDEWSLEAHNHDDEDDDEDSISDYHTGRRRGFEPIDSPWIRRQPKPPVYFGVELEVEAPTSGQSLGEYAAQVRQSVRSDFIASIEHDGSLSHGFEIVTNPAGLDVHREQWLNANLQDLKSHNTTTCGLHVHMTRNALRPLVLGRMSEFLNADHNKTFIETFCRRSFNRYAQGVKDMTITKAQKPRGDRYEVLNLTNRNTVEFRLPKGTTKDTTIIATVEFCNALIRMCSVVSSRKLTTQAFKEFIVRDEMLADTRFLRGYLIDRGLAVPQEMRLPKPKKIPAPPATATPPAPPSEDVSALADAGTPGDGLPRSNPKKRRRNSGISYATLVALEYLETGEW